MGVLFCSFMGQVTEKDDQLTNCRFAGGARGRLVAGAGGHALGSPVTPLRAERASASDPPRLLRVARVLQCRDTATRAQSIVFGVSCTLFNCDAHAVQELLSHTCSITRASVGWLIVPSRRLV